MTSASGSTRGSTSSSRATCSCTDAEVPILREFLLRGGTLTLDDFHGPFEWDLTVRQLARVFPDREVVELAPPHPIFTCFYRLDKYPQIPGLGLVLQRPHLGEGRLRRRTCAPSSTTPAGRWC